MICDWGNMALYLKAKFSSFISTGNASQVTAEKMSWPGNKFILALNELNGEHKKDQFFRHVASIDKLVM